MAKQPRPRVNRKGGRCVGTIVQWEAILFFFFTFHRQGCVCVCARVDLIDRRDFERGLFDYFEFNELIVKRLDSDQVWGQCSAMCFGWYKIRGGRATTATWTAKETFTKTSRDKRRREACCPFEERRKAEKWAVGRGAASRGGGGFDPVMACREEWEMSPGGADGSGSPLAFLFPFLSFLFSPATQHARAAWGWIVPARH